MSYAEPEDSGRKLTGIIVVVLLHAVLIYGLINGLARKIVEVVRPPLETKIIEEIKPPPPEIPVPPPPPRMAAPPPPYIPPVEVQIQPPPQAPTITAQVSEAPPSPAPPAPASMVSSVAESAPAEAPGPVVDAPPAPPKPHVPIRTSAVVDAGNCAKPDYPPAALRAQETGTVTLSFLIDVDGKVVEGKVERSSGFRRLDDAARRGLARCKFKPATVDGKPEQAWARLEYVWKLE